MISILWVIMLDAVASMDIKENEIVLGLHSVMVIFSFIRQLTHKLHQEEDDGDVTNEWMFVETWLELCQFRVKSCIEDFI